MNYIMSGIFFITCYPILLMMYFMLRNAVDKNGYCFGTTLKRELRDDEAIRSIDREYRRKLKISTIILGIIPIPFVFIPYFSISMSLWMVWILLICFVPYWFLAIANGKVKEIKKEKGWNVEATVSYSDLKTASSPRKVKLITFLPAMILSVIPVIIAFVMFRGHGYVMYGWFLAIFALCTFLFYICGVWTDKQKIVVICEDADVNMNFARAKKQVWKTFAVVSAWINTVFIWVLLFYMTNSGLAVGGILFATIIYCIFFLGLCFWAMSKIWAINKKYESKRTLMDVADDDKNWLWGSVYYNKNDKHYMIESRLGTGTTVNLGNKAGMATMVVSGALLLLIPIISVWMIMVEFTPIHVTVENNTIICEQLSVEYEIPLYEIDSYEVMTELPDLIKVNGMGMDNILSGTYEVYREGMYELFLNPQNELFVKIVVDDRTYIIGGEDDIKTQAIIDIIKAYIK